MAGTLPALRKELPRGEVMQTPDEVAARLRLKALGWGIKRIARELGCSRMTVRRYAGRRPDAVPRWRPPRALAGLEDWGRSGFAAMPATPMWFGRSMLPRRASS